MRFFLAAIRLAKDLPDESIANFAVRRTSKICVDKENWDLYEAFIIRMAIENSNCIDSVVKVLCTYAAIGYEINSSSMSRFIDKIITDHAPYNHHFEVAWALWLSRSLNIRLSPAASSFVMRIENDVCAILALHLRGRHLLSGGTRALSWMSAVDEGDLYGDHWLLIYESALHKGWPIVGASAAVSANKFFKSLKAEGISFYNTRAYNRPLNIPRIEAGLRRALSGRKRAILPGAVLGVSAPREERAFERWVESMVRMMRTILSRPFRPLMIARMKNHCSLGHPRIAAITLTSTASLRLHPHVFPRRVAKRFQLAIAWLPGRDFLRRLRGQPGEPVWPP
jgi:hypothetical protein